MSELYSALVIGLFGSLHCVGMCGPLVLSLPLSKKERISIASQSLVYNFGRAVTYGLMGMGMGIMGWGLELAGMQKLFSISLGLILLYSALSHLSPSIQLTNIMPRIALLNSTNKKLKKALVINSNASAIKIGMLNGLLPCGLVYVALANSVLLSSPLYSSMYMVIFGLGTIPLMLIVMIGGNLYKGLTFKLRKFLPFALAALGLYLIYRGFALHLSDNPQDIVNGIAKVSCH